MKKLLFALLIGLSGELFALSNPVRYVQISTNSLTQQTGSFNVSGGTMVTSSIGNLSVTTETILISNISTETVKSLSVTDNVLLSTGNLTANTINIGTGTIITLGVTNVNNSSTTYTVSGSTQIVQYLIAQGQLSGKGTITNDNASSGYIGEYISSITASFTPGSSNTYYDMLSIQLTPGDWDITAVIYTNTGSSYTDILLGVSTNSGNTGTGLSAGVNRLEDVNTYVTSGIHSMSIPNYRVQPTAATTYYMKFLVLTSGSTFAATGRLTARRIR